MRNKNVVIIDSGIDIKHSALKKYISNIEMISNIYDIKSDERDYLGHGTSISYILLKHIDDIKLHSINIFKNNYEVSEELLIKSLNYVDEYLNADIVHISAGIIFPEYKEELFDICKRLNDKGVIIVSAFDNNGMLSYPAAFDFVIGVAGSNKCLRSNQYIYVENSMINILGSNTSFYLPSINGSYRFVAGSSFCSPFITVEVAKHLSYGLDRDNILECLKNNAMKCISFMDKDKEYEINKIKRASIFPLNKEMHSLISNTDLLDFEIVDIYDYPISHNIGKEASDLIFLNVSISKKIKSINELLNKGNFSNIDTLIIGHTAELSQIYGTDYITRIFKFCADNDIYIYSLDSLKESRDSMNKKKSFYPELTLPSNVEFPEFGRLYNLSSLALCICGTSPHQGKFNLQLDLRREFIKNGYTIGQLGTEPTSLLFGMDEMIHNGHETESHLIAEEEIQYYNKILKKIDNNDIVIMGLQSNTIHNSFGNIRFFPISQNHLLLAANPDISILCVNINDEDEYIRRTILYLEEIMCIKVIAIVIYPRIFENYLYNSNNEVKGINSDTLIKKRKYIEKKFCKPSFINGETNLSKKICNIIVSDYGQ